MDKKFVKKRWKKANRSPLKAAAGLTRKEARQSIRTDRSKAQKPSPPGKPPKSRATGSPLRMIRFAVLENKTQAIVGPIGFGAGGKTIPSLHEKGGRAKILVRIGKRGRKASPLQEASFKRLLAAKRIKTKKIKTRRITVTFPKGKQSRSFMLRAVKKLKGKYPKLWRQAFKR